MPGSLSVPLRIEFITGSPKNIMNNIILASSCQIKLASWRQSLCDLSSITLVTVELISSNLETLRVDVARIKPQILLLDIDLLGLDGSREIANLRKLSADTKIIVLTGDITENIEWNLLKAGMRGCCRYDVKPGLLNKVVVSVQKGELWVRRTLICKLIDELGNTTSKYETYRASHDLLSKLTRREYDIALLVGNGQSNKKIAQTCAITERTVKAHLTEVYLKLGVADRLNLALVLSAEERGDSVHSDFPLNGSLVKSMRPNSTTAIGNAVNRRLSA